MKQIASSNKCQASDYIKINKKIVLPFQIER